MLSAIQEIMWRSDVIHLLRHYIALTNKKTKPKTRISPIRNFYSFILKINIYIIILIDQVPNQSIDEEWNSVIHKKKMQCVCVCGGERVRG